MSGKVYRSGEVYEMIRLEERDIYIYELYSCRMDTGVAASKKMQKSLIKSEIK